MAKKYKWCACGAYLVTSPHQCDSRHLPPIEAPPIRLSQSTVPTVREAQLRIAELERELSWLKKIIAEEK